FLFCFYFWSANRHRSSFFDYHGREAINFQIAIYLYLLISLFLAYIFVGVLMVLLLLLLQFLFGLVACINSLRGIWFRYPISIEIVSRQLPTSE
ncbi:MAG: DUF4870 domain-containing protein, partial [Pseudomonadota bacterium]